MRLAPAGFGLVKALAEREDAVVFAGTRNPAAATELAALAQAKPNLHVVQLTSADEADNAAAVAEIERTAGALHVVISNAGRCLCVAHRRASLTAERHIGIGNSMEWPLETPAAALREHLEVRPPRARAGSRPSSRAPQVNTVGASVLFQATYPLLRASTPAPKFIGISATTGSIGMQAPWRAQGLPNGASKAALNFVLRALRGHYDGLGRIWQWWSPVGALMHAAVCFPICPGLVDTELSKYTSSSAGLPLVADRLDHSPLHRQERQDRVHEELPGPVQDHRRHRDAPAQDHRLRDARDGRVPALGRRNAPVVVCSRASDRFYIPARVQYRHDTPPHSRTSHIYLC
jgi:NAD(P)-dependent dehydrogenase (short-subunit alcohol dehydrogenase family)